jgi:hypothetical protein
MEGDERRRRASVTVVSPRYNRWRQIFRWLRLGKLDQVGGNLNPDGEVLVTIVSIGAQDERLARIDDESNRAVRNCLGLASGRTKATGSLKRGGQIVYGVQMRRIVRVVSDVDHKKIDVSIG